MHNVRVCEFAFLASLIELAPLAAAEHWACPADTELACLGAMETAEHEAWHGAGAQTSGCRVDDVDRAQRSLA